MAADLENAVLPERPAGNAGRRLSRWPAAAGLIVANCTSMAASQRFPYRGGLLTRCSRFAPKVSAAVTASRDSTVPAKALRTGTAVRPRPGSSASRMPTAAVTGAATLVGHAVSRERGPVAAGLPLRRAPADTRRRAGQATRVTSSITMAAAPATSTVTSR
jgi:hypothetical protein